MYFSLTFCLGSLLMSVTFFFPFPIPFSFLVWSVDMGESQWGRIFWILGAAAVHTFSSHRKSDVRFTMASLLDSHLCTTGGLGFAVCQSSAAIKTGIFPQQKHSEMPLHTFYLIPFVVFATLESDPGNHIHALLILVTEWIILLI